MCFAIPSGSSRCHGHFWEIFQYAWKDKNWDVSLHTMCILRTRSDDADHFSQGVNPSQMRIDIQCSRSAHNSVCVAYIHDIFRTELCTMRGFVFAYIRTITRLLERNLRMLYFDNPLDNLLSNLLTFCFFAINLTFPIRSLQFFMFSIPFIAI
jgi:hypothetical protein